MVTIVIRKNLVKKAAGVSVACALTIGMNVVIAGPEESTLFQQMGLIKTAAGAEVTNATVAPAIAPTPISINNQKRVTLNQVVSDEFVGPMLPSATPTTTPRPQFTGTNGKANGKACCQKISQPGLIRC